jgi:RHS repeat-associated protein
MEVDYFFDGLGRRIAKKVKTRSRDFTQTYSYLANQDKILLAKSGENNILMQVDGQGIDEHFAQITKDGIKTFISDHLGTVVNSEVTEQNKSTGAFGETIQEVPKMEITSNPVVYGFTGRQFEPETGLYYYRNRSYDPSSGRFMTKDPMGIEGGDVNLYRYVSNSPFQNTDPHGELMQELIVVGLVAVAATATVYMAEKSRMSRAEDEAQKNQLRHMNDANKLPASTPAGQSSYERHNQQMRDKWKREDEAKQKAVKECLK